MTERRASRLWSVPVLCVVTGVFAAAWMARTPGSSDLGVSRLFGPDPLAPVPEARTPAEKAFTQALLARYAEDAASAPADRKPLDEAYERAMAAVVRQLPQDLDAATLHAEALMDLQPWAYYDAKAQPIGRTGEIVARLESVLARNANCSFSVSAQSIDTLPCSMLEATRTPLCT